MPVFHEVEITYDGETYTVVPSMALLRQIELQGISILHVAHQAAQGKPQASLMATVVAAVLRAAGAKVTDVDLYAEFTQGDTAKVAALYNQVLDAISPSAPDEKKPVAPDKKRPSK